MVYNRRRGTAIVEFPEGILVVSQGSDTFMLAGGGANKGESRRDAAMRELKEETGLEPIESIYLFPHKGRLHKSYNGKGHFRDNHKVFLIKANGTPKPQREVKHIAYFKNGSGSSIKLYNSTKDIIERFLAMKGAGLIPLECPHCSGTLNPNDFSGNTIQCRYCGRYLTKSL